MFVHFRHDPLASWLAVLSLGCLFLISRIYYKPKKSQDYLLIITIAIMTLTAFGCVIYLS